MSSAAVAADQTPEAANFTDGELDTELQWSLDNLVRHGGSAFENRLEAYDALASRFGLDRVRRGLEQRLPRPEYLFLIALLEPGDPSGAALSKRQRTDRARVCRNWELSPSDLARRFPTGPKGPSHQFLTKLSTLSSRVDLTTAEPLLQSAYASRTAKSRGAGYSGVSSRHAWLPHDVITAMELSGKFGGGVSTRRATAKRRKLNDGPPTSPSRQDTQAQDMAGTEVGGEDDEEDEDNVDVGEAGLGVFDGASPEIDNRKGSPSGMRRNGERPSTPVGTRPGRAERRPPPDTSDTPELPRRFDNDKHALADPHDARSVSILIDPSSPSPAPRLKRAFRAPSARGSSRDSHAGTRHRQATPAVKRIAQAVPRDHSPQIQTDETGVDTAMVLLPSADASTDSPALSSRPTPSLPPEPLERSASPKVRAAHRQNLASLLSSLVRLREGEWLNDVLVNAAISRCRNADVGTIDSISITASYTAARNPQRSFSSQFPPAKEMTLLPHCTGVHWQLFCWRRDSGSNQGRTRQVLEIYDSFSMAAGAARPAASASGAAKAVTDFLSRASGVPARDFFPVNKDCPQQQNADDCGVFTIYFALALADRRPMPPSLDAATVRKWLRHTLPTSAPASLPLCQWASMPPADVPLSQLVPVEDRPPLTSALTLAALPARAGSGTRGDAAPSAHRLALAASAARLDVLELQLHILRLQTRRISADHLRLLAAAVQRERQAEDQQAQQAQVHDLRQFLQRRSAALSSRADYSGILELLGGGRGGEREPTEGKIEELLTAAESAARRVEFELAPGTLFGPSQGRLAVGRKYRSAVVRVLLLRYMGGKRLRLEREAAHWRKQVQDVAAAHHPDEHTTHM